MIAAVEAWKTEYVDIKRKSPGEAYDRLISVILLLLRYTESLLSIWMLPITSGKRVIYKSYNFSFCISL